MAETAARNREGCALRGGTIPCTFPRAEPIRWNPPTALPPAEETRVARTRKTRKGFVLLRTILFLCTP